jgi:branched-chain amino acid transport system permease protein
MFLRLLISGLVIGGIYGMIALGYSLIYKASGLMNFTQGDFLTIGGFLGLMFFKTLGFPFIAAFVLTVAIAFALGMVMEKGIIRQLQKKNVMAIYVVLATIAVSYIIQNSAQAIWGSITLQFPQVFPWTSIKVLSAEVQPEALLCVILSLVTMVVLHFFMTRTKMGRAMRASAMDPMAARSCGVNTSLTTGITWGLSAGLAALGGMLLGPIYGIYPVLGATIGRKGFSSAVIGGYGNMYGAMAGGFLLGLAETMVSGYVSSTYRNLLAFIVLIVFLFLKPTGLSNERAIADD